MMKDKKDVLFLCQYFYPEYVSSATLPYQTARVLVSAGFDVGVLCGYPKEYSNVQNVSFVEVHDGIYIKRVRYVQLERAKTIGRIINQLSFTTAVLGRLVQFRNYRSVIVYSNPPILPFVAAIASWVFGCSVVFVSYDVYPEMALLTGNMSSTSLLHKAMRFVNRIVFKRAKRVIALSQEMRDYLLDNRKLGESTAIEVIPNWCPDEDLPALAEVRNETLRRLRAEKGFIVSYFGNLGICQDHETLFGAIRQLRNQPEVHFLFAGHGAKMDLLKETIQREKLNNVTIFDFLHGSDFREALAISDCFALSLHKELTGLAVPSKTYTYMMVGKPIIAIIGANSDIARDLLDNGAGYVVEAGDDASMVAAITELLRDEDKRLLMGQRCRGVYLQKYTVEECTGKYVDLFREILGA